MDLTNVLLQLRKERDAIDVVIAHLEDLERAIQWNTSRHFKSDMKGPVTGTNGFHNTPEPSARGESFKGSS
jgi:hypothetical protein